MLGDLASWVTDVVDALGYLGVALLVVLENVFPPIPSEIVLPFAGFVAEPDGIGAVAAMVGAATVGSVVGAWVLYGVAAVIGDAALHRFVARAGRWFGVKVSDLDRAEQWFDRRANVAVLVGRCVPLIRSLVSIPAGFRRMPPVRFTVLTAVGSLVWNVALIGAGAALGTKWDLVEQWVGVLQWVVVVAIGAAVLRWAVEVRRRRRRGSAPA
jgi:membrane protein DedA with SNARE-associated domain